MTRAERDESGARTEACESPARRRTSSAPDEARVDRRAPSAEAIGVPRSVVGRRPASANPTTPIAIAPPITEGERRIPSSARSRNPSTFAGLAICETMSPIPKARPATKAKKRVHERRQPAMTCASTNTVANPAAMNTSVATSERGDSPRQSANAMTAGAPGPDSASRRRPGRRRRRASDNPHRSRSAAVARTGGRAIGATISPAMNATRHAPHPASDGRSSPPTMPLMPATRPLTSANIAAAKPMIAPPASADHGVNACPIDASLQRLV